MTGPWWRQGSGQPLPAPRRGHWPHLPDLAPGGADAVRTAVKNRIGGFTPDWKAAQSDDPGVTLTYAFAEQMAAVHGQVNQLPESQARRYLSLAGVGPAPSVATTSIVTIGIDPAAPAPASLLERTVLLGPARDDGTPSIFETTRGLSVVPATIGAIVLQTGTSARFLDANAAAAPFDLPVFGPTPTPGNRIWLGLTPGADTSELAFHLSMGGTTTLSSESTAVEWSVLRAGQEVPASVVVDETLGFARSGIIELRLPDGWGPEVHPSPNGPVTPYRWLTARLTVGGFTAPPRITAVHLNAVRVEGVETRRGEPVIPIIDPTAPDGQPVYRLSAAPVLPGTVELEVDNAVSTDPFGADSTRSSAARWTEVTSFAGHGQGDHVFMVDAGTGQLSFPAQGRGAFRRVVALAYQVNGGSVTFSAGTSLPLRDTLPSVFGATALVAGQGGAPTEPVADALRRGPARARSGHRAVTSDDYVVEALAAPGADVSRVLVQPGRDGEGRPRPGWVRLAVLSKRPDPTGTFTPTPDALDALERFLTATVIPVGTQVAAVAASFVGIRVEAQILIDRGANPTALLHNVTTAVDRYLDPHDTPDHDGFPFGGVVAHRGVLAAIASQPGVVRVDVRLVENGRRLAACADAVLDPTALPVAETHRITVLVEEAVR